MNWSLLVWLAASVASPCPSDLLGAAGFPSGPYAVGIRHERFHDAARAWPAAADPTGARGRPVQVALWYPAAAGDTPGATLADLMRADAPGAAAPNAARAAFDAGAERPLTDAEWERTLETRTAARPLAVPLPGRRALLLMQGGINTRSFMLAPLADLLASHGYVVAALGTDGASETERLGIDAGGVRAQLEDMKLVLRSLRENAQFDPARVGLVGWSVGGVSQALLRIEQPDAFRAAISLDSGSGYAYGAALLREAGLDPARLRVPFLHFEAGRASGVPRDDSYLRAHAGGVGRQVLLGDLRHGDFTLPYGAGRVLATGQAASPDAPRLARELLAFLESELPAGHTTERVTLASDGWSLVGDRTLPDGPDRVPAALLLNRAAGDRRAYRGLAEALARQGVASLRLDLRAHGESTNLGRFQPPEGLPLLEGSHRDVAVGLQALRDTPRVDANRLAVVGASYSGEAMMEAGRADGWATAYVGLSPGSLSDESIAAIDRHRLPWLLVVARHERHLKEVEAALREQSRSAEFLELPGTSHGTGLLGDHPGLAELLATWLRRRLAPPL